MEYGTIFLGLGSNRGDRKLNLDSALDVLKGLIIVDKVSSVYETEPKDVSGHAPYLNMVVAGQSELSPHELLRKMQAVEKDMGRTTKGELKPRVIDIDILLYNQNHIQSQELQIPHPRMQDRNFVLIPFHEIAPDYVHPSYGKTISELLLVCNDKNIVRLVS